MSIFKIYSKKNISKRNIINIFNKTYNIIEKKERSKHSLLIYLYFSYFNIISKILWLQILKKKNKMEKQPKRIYFVSWKKHKVDQALTQVDNICTDFINELLIESILDLFKTDYGCPGAISVSKIIQVDPVIPQLKDDPFNFDTPIISRSQRCPICHDTIDASRFTSHLITKCFKECKDKMEILRKYFETTPQFSNTTT